MRGFILALMLLVCRAGVAAPPDNPNPDLSPWYNSLHQPRTGILCCSIADCRPTRSRLRNDHYEAFIGGHWRVVPDDKVLQRVENPTGHAVVCWTERMGILCFIRAPES